MGNHICGPLPAGCHVEGQEVNCQTLAAVKQVAAHQSLPATGAPTGPMIGIGLVLALIGAALVRRTRTA